MTKLRTIEGAYLEIKEQDPKTAITKHSIRQAVTSGAVPSKKAGRKYIVNVDCVIAYFSDEEFEHIRGFINSPNNRIVERR